MKLSRNHLTVLLNALYDAGATPLTVSHPAEEIGDLLRIDLDDPYESTVSVLADGIEYDDRRDDIHRAYDEAAYDELPDKTEYIRLLVAAGVGEVDNREEIETFLTRYGYPDLEAGHPPVMAGIDANILPWRLQEVLGFDPALNHAGRSPITGYALASGVKTELDWHYKQHHSEQVSSAFGSEFEALAGQPAGANREGMLGLYEYRRLMATRQTDIVDCDTGDEAIVEGYRAYHHDENRKDVVLFSNDYGFVDQATDADLPAVHVTYPVDVERRSTVSWDQAATLLYLFSIVFGVITLPKVTMYGVWDGKSGRHWQNESLRVDCRSPKVRERLERDKNVVETYEDMA